jgi:hypothetical protein
MIIYSEAVPGTIGNYNWTVRFDSEDGYLGLTQNDERILLCPSQVKELAAWLRKYHKEQE